MGRLGRGVYEKGDGWEAGGGLRSGGGPGQQRLMEDWVRPRLACPQAAVAHLHGP